MQLEKSFYCHQVNVPKVMDSMELHLCANYIADAINGLTSSHNVVLLFSKVVKNDDVPVSSIMQVCVS